MNIRTYALLALSFILCVCTQNFAQEKVSQNDVTLVINDDVKTEAENEKDVESTDGNEPAKEENNTEKKEQSPSSGLAVNIVQNNVGGFFPVFFRKRQPSSQSKFYLV